MKRGRLAAADPVLIECRYNDPEVSFFVVRAGVPHGEAVAPVAGSPRPASTSPNPAPRPLDLLDLRKYRLRPAPR